MLACLNVPTEKLAKRGISMKSVEQCPPDISPLGHARQVIKIKQRELQQYVPELG